MNLQPIMALTNGTLFRDLNEIVRDGIVDRIDEIVNRSESTSCGSLLRCPARRSLR